MKIRTVPILTILAGFIQLISCLRMSTVVWPTESISNLKLTHLAYHTDTDQLYIGATNNIFHLQGETLGQLNSATTGPVNETTDDENTVLIVNKTLTGSVFITTCSSTKTHCAQRNVTDIREIIEELTPAVLTTNATVFTAVKKERRPFTFVACPHSEQPTASADACSQPGIAWTAFSQDVKKEIKFKASSDTNIVTERFIGSSVIADIRIFFSILRNKHTNQKHSRLAQICQYHRDESENEHTYADMVLKCGNYTILTDVEEYEVDDKHLFITTFTDEDGQKSGVCVYSFAEIKIKLKENIRRCYYGDKVSGQDDYIYGDDGRCSTRATVNLDGKDEDYFLCNKDRFPLYFSVIGTEEYSLNKDPILSYEQLVLTAVVVTLVDTDLVAFLGTDHGDVRKAVVYPLEDARKLDDITIVANKERINPDMFIDESKESIYAMTSFKVAKIPVQTCSDHTTCKSCLSNRDPYCGWCVLESRCATNTSCNTTWIPAAPGNATCLRMTITPSDIELPVQSSKIGRAHV